jgi:hypothetical protein
MCVETSIASHVSAFTSPGVDQEAMWKMRKKCIKDIRNTVGTIRFDNIYAFQNGQISRGEEELDEAEY